jgi:hypothetical protein
VSGWDSTWEKTVVQAQVYHESEWNRGNNFALGGGGECLVFHVEVEEVSYLVFRVHIEEEEV